MKLLAEQFISTLAFAVSIGLTVNLRVGVSIPFGLEKTYVPSSWFMAFFCATIVLLVPQNNSNLQKYLQGLVHLLSSYFSIGFKFL